MEISTTLWGISGLAESMGRRQSKERSLGRDEQSDYLYLQLHQCLQGEHLQARVAEVAALSSRKSFKHPGAKVWIWRQGKSFKVLRAWAAQ